jgi:hypothetical protein
VLANCYPVLTSNLCDVTRDQSALRSRIRPAPRFELWHFWQGARHHGDPGRIGDPVPVFPWSRNPTRPAESLEPPTPDCQQSMPRVTPGAPMRERLKAIVELISIGVVGLRLTPRIDRRASRSLTLRPSNKRFLPNTKVRWPNSKANSRKRSKTSSASWQELAD